MKGFLRIFFTSAFLFLLPFVCWGQSGGSSASPINVTLQNPLSQTTFCQLFKQILDVALALGTPVIIFFIVLAGFKFVWARGNAEKLTEARDNLRNTILGIVLFLGAWALTMVVAGTINTLNSAGGGGSPLIASC